MSRGLLSSVDLTSSDLRTVRDQLTRDVNERRVGILQVYRAITLPGGEVDVLPLVDVAAPAMPQGWPRAAVDRLAARVAGGQNSEPRMLEEVSGGGDLIRAASVIRKSGAATDRRRRGERLPLGRSRRPLAAHDQGVRGLHAAACAPSAARRRLPVVLRHGDAAHSGQLHVDGVLPRQAHHPAGADAVVRGARDRSGTLRPAHRARGERRVRLDDRGVQLDGGRAGVEPPAAGARGGRSRAEESGSRRPAALHRNDSRARRDRRRVDRSGGTDRHGERGGDAAARSRRDERRAVPRSTSSRAAI